MTYRDHSKQLLVDSPSKFIKRIVPLPHVRTTDVQARTCIVEGLHPSLSVDQVITKFAHLGKISLVVFHTGVNDKKSLMNWKKITKSDRFVELVFSNESVGRQAESWT